METDVESIRGLQKEKSSKYGQNVVYKTQISHKIQLQTK